MSELTVNDLHLDYGSGVREALRRARLGKG